MLFDAHMHMFDAENVDEIILKANSKGVSKFISNSTNPTDALQNIELAKKNKDIYLGLGIYPLELEKAEDLKKIDYIFDLYNNLDQSIRVRTLIGEIGLDFKYSNEENIKIQYEGYKKQIEFAKEKNIFVEVHSRYAIRETLDTLIEMNTKKAVMHWYTQSKKYADRASNNGYFITVGPTYLYDNNVYNVIKDIDPKLILFETDFPIRFDGILQEPYLIYEIAQKYCKDFDISFDELKSIQEKSFKLLFNI